MEYVAIIISLISLVGAGFAFIRANSSHNIMVKRVEALREKINMLSERPRKHEGNSGRGNRAANEPNEGGRRKKQRPEEQEERQNKPRQERPERQNEPRQKQPRQEQQSRPEQQPREQQPEQREQRERQPRQQQQPNQQQPDQQLEDGTVQQPRRRRENRRRNEPRDRSELQEAGDEQSTPQRNAPTLEFTQGGLLDELEQSAAAPDQQAALAVVESGTRYAIIPEDGVIRAHQLQQQPDSDSYIEVDVPADGGHITKYRFNLAGNHAFVIAQGIDRLENAFDFEKPSNRMVNKVVQQQDGVLTRVGNGWRIHEKARIDFR